jgi:hypothetical protein
MHEDPYAAPLTGGPRPAPSPFGSTPEPVGPTFGSSPFGGSPFETPAHEPSAEDAPFEDALLDDDLVSAVFATTGPFAAVAAPEATAPLAPFGTASFGTAPVASPAPFASAASTGQAPAGLSASSLFGAPSPAPSAVPGVPNPRSSADGAPGPSATSAGAKRDRRPVNPLLAVAVGGAAVVAGGLVALALLGGSGDDVPTGAVVVAGRPSATASASPTASAGTGSTDPVTGAFASNARDPFLPLVGAPADGGASTALPTGDATLPSTGAVGGTTGTAGGTSAGGTTGGTSSGTTGGTSSGTTGGTSGGTGSDTTSGADTQLTKAQVCTAVTDPMNQVEQLLTNSASGSTGAVDAGLALRNPVAVLRTAVSLTSDSRLAGRLDIAASTAEALRAQLIAGTAVTSGQVATQVSRDADVRSACA